MEETVSMTRGIFCYYYVNLILYIVVLTLNMPLTCIGKAPIIESTESAKRRLLGFATGEKRKGKLNV